MRDSDSTKVEVTELNHRWMQAYVKRDAAFLERFMSDDYVGTFPDGTVHDKRGEIEAVKAGAIAITEMKPKEMTVRTYGDAAVITGWSTIEAVVNGQDLSDEYRFTDVWVKQGGQWQAVASQVTRIEAPQSSP